VRRYTTAAVVLLVGPIAACGGDGREMARYASLGPLYEARAWLAGNASPYGFASNRFDGTAAARAFVDTLYALGADTVYVLNVQQDSAWLATEGFPYADALLVRLPDARAARRALLDVVNREARREGFPPERDRGRRYLYLWWD
jgi:hypothetical protein